MKRTLKIALFLAVCTGGICQVHAQTQASPGASGPVSGINSKDSRILAELMAVNGYELTLIKLTLQKGQTPELKAVVTKMMADHQRLTSQLNNYANRFNVGIDPEKREKYAAKIGKWESKPVGNEWDRDMIEELVDLHKDGIDMLEGAAKDVTDADFKSTLSQTALKMHDHLDMLTPLKGKIKGGDMGATGTAADVQTASMNGNTVIVDKMKDGSSKDAKFFSDLMGTNLYELRLMEIVLKKGQSRDLKNVVQQMMEDHQMIATRLKEYGSKMSYGIEPDKGSKYNDKVAKWETDKGGMEWDADIIEELRDLHKDVMDMLQDAQTDVKDKELAGLISYSLDIEKRHLGMIAPLKEKVKKPWKEDH